jgi:rhodanese-related sulfurtransferase
MAKTFRELVAEAREGVDTVSPEEAQRRMQQDPDALVVDVREPGDIVSTGAIPGSVNVPLGVLPIKADQELPGDVTDPQLQDRSRQVMVTCALGGQAALGAKTLKDMGFQNVSIIEGGTQGWKDAGLPTEQPGSSDD